MNILALQASLSTSKLSKHFLSKHFVKFLNELTCFNKFLHKIYRKWLWNCLALRDTVWI